MNAEDIEREEAEFLKKHKSQGKIRFSISFESSFEFNRKDFDFGEPEEKADTKAVVKEIKLGKKGEQKGLF